MKKRNQQTRYSDFAKRAYRLGYKVRFSDPIQREAMGHIHIDLSKLVERRGAFRSAASDVRIQVISEIRARSIAQQGSNAGSASSALVAAVLAAAALVSSLFIAFFNGFYNWVVKMTDPQTGKVAGLSDNQIGQFLGQTTELLFLIAFCVVVGGIVMFYFARSKDSSRGVYAAWLTLYEEDHLVASDRRLLGRRTRFWFSRR